MIRHYANGKFYYHQVSIPYAESKLNELNTPQTNPKSDQLRGNIDQSNIDQLNSIIDLKPLNSGSESENTSGRSLAWLGHRPPTPTTRVQIPATAPLQVSRSWCAIRRCDSYGARDVQLFFYC